MGIEEPFCDEDKMPLAKYYCKSHWHSSSNNLGLSDFPAEMFTSHGPFIATVDFSFNQLVTLPSNFWTMLPKLQHLTLNENWLKSLPEGIGLCPDLRHLSLAGNQLEELPKDFGSSAELRELNISNNKFTEIPSSVMSCTKLTSLFASSMKLTDIPNNLYKLENLVQLDVSGNFLSKLPKSFAQLESLQYLSLNGVPWITDQGTLLGRDTYNSFLLSSPALASLTFQVCVTCSVCIGMCVHKYMYFAIRQFFCSLLVHTVM